MLQIIITINMKKKLCWQGVGMGRNTKDLSLEYTVINLLFTNRHCTIVTYKDMCVNLIASLTQKNVLQNIFLYPTYAKLRHLISGNIIFMRSLIGRSHTIIVRHGTNSRIELRTTQQQSPKLWLCQVAARYFFIVKYVKTNRSL